MRVTDLWIPILASGVATHILSTLSWTALPHHKPEWKKLPIEDSLHATLETSVPPGQYVFPHAVHGEPITDEFKQKYARCSGMLVVWPGPLSMGKAILKTLIALFVMAFVIGYLASLALPAGANFMSVFRFVTTAGLLAHVSAKFPIVFWFRRRIAMEVIDGIAYAIATGLIFAWLWPR